MLVMIDSQVLANLHKLKHETKELLEAIDDYFVNTQHWPGKRLNTIMSKVSNSINIDECERSEHD